MQLERLTTRLGSPIKVLARCMPSTTDSHIAAPDMHAGNVGWTSIDKWPFAKHGLWARTAGCPSKCPGAALWPALWPCVVGLPLQSIQQPSSCHAVYSGTFAGAHHALEDSVIHLSNSPVQHFERSTSASHKLVIILYCRGLQVQRCGTLHDPFFGSTNSCRCMG